MRLPAKSRYLLLAIVFAIAVPTAATASWLSWWFSAPADPVQNVTFNSVATGCCPSITDLNFLYGKYQSFSRIKLVDVITSATVNNGAIQITTFPLTDNNGTTATFTFPLANLTTDYFGSSYKSNVTIDVVGSTSYTITGRSTGRITEKNGLYYLTGNIWGVAWEDTGSGAGTYHIVRLCLKGTVAVPAAP